MTRNQPLTGSDATKASIQAQAAVLVTLSTLLQCVALLGVLPIAPGSLGRHVYSTVELLLVAGLLYQGWRIRQWAVASGQGALVRQIARLCFCSLLLCGLGDIVNRNYLERYYPWDEVIKHGYLVQSILFFFPGYALVVVANWRLGAPHVHPRTVVWGTLAALGLGALAFFGSYDPRVNALASAAMLAYTLLHAVLVLSVVWVVRACGWAASSLVAMGVLLAAVADALIGHFWIFSDHFPVIEHVNWIVYFASLAMIQQLPFLAARAHPAD